MSWLSGVPLPPIPPIDNPKYADIVFTHSSARSQQHSSSSFDLTSGAADLDNEKLEHVGDGILGAFITFLLNELYPDLVVGSATLLKSRLVSNATNAQLSLHYGLPKHLRAAHAAALPLRNQPNVQADLFEAYIGGLFYSYLHRGTPRSNPTPPLTPQPHEPTASLADGSPRRMSYGQAMDELGLWLRAVYTPLAHKMMDQIRSEQSTTDINVALEQQAAGSTALLNQYYLTHESRLPSYAYSASADSSGMWTCICVAQRRDGSELRSEASGTTKKVAATLAAYKICKELSLVP
ncbi:ribonuclease III domain-containing protein [Kockovaella imperatae]|uniref:Ribonuclease III domain-containing protein n=1 Tax=Kockovaella imperatae TaxID=4999 RepID=A0A1Y1ULK0_9TREE|nr:ribonuclease III domain-containing protein [Kockovaella imperatae]ORX38928.1 ribonuclease III domain-containing protein [Kockovaella imperatae]